LINSGLSNRAMVLKVEVLLASFLLFSHFAQKIGAVVALGLGG
jgi:hypothetical protein